MLTRAVPGGGRARGRAGYHNNAPYDNGPPKWQQRPPPGSPAAKRKFTTPNLTHCMSFIHRQIDNNVLRLFCFPVISIPIVSWALGIAAGLGF